MLVLKNLEMTKSVWERFCKTLINAGYERGVDIENKITWEPVARGPYKFKPYTISEELYEEISTLSSGKKKKVDATIIEQSTSIEDDEIYSEFKPREAKGVSVVGEGEVERFDISKIVVNNVKNDYDYENEHVPGRLATENVYNLSLDHTAEITEKIENEPEKDAKITWNEAFEEVAGALDIKNILLKARKLFLEKRGKSTQFSEVEKIDNYIDQVSKLDL